MGVEVFPSQHRGLAVRVVDCEQGLEFLSRTDSGSATADFAPTAIRRAARCEDEIDRGARAPVVVILALRMRRLQQNQPTCLTAQLGRLFVQVGGGAGTVVGPAVSLQSTRRADDALGARLRRDSFAGAPVGLHRAIVRARISVGQKIHPATRASAWRSAARRSVQRTQSAGGRLQAICNKWGALCSSSRGSRLGCAGPFRIKATSYPGSAKRFRMLETACGEDAGALAARSSFQWEATRQRFELGSQRALQPCLGCLSQERQNQIAGQVGSLRH